MRSCELFVNTRTGGVDSDDEHGNSSSRCV